MKQIIYTILVLLFISCTSSKKLLQDGRYDDAIKKSADKLKKDSKNTEEAEIMEKAYSLANQQNLDRINFLNMEGRPDRWEKIYFEYLTIKDRQAVIRPLLPLTINGRTYNFPVQNYDREIIQAKNKAGEYFYMQAKELMKNRTKNSYQQAYYAFEKSRKYSASFSDIDRLQQEAREKGIYHVLLVPENNTQIQMPNEFIRGLVEFDLNKLNSDWILYYNQSSSRNNYDYNVYVVIKLMDVLPEKIIKNVKRESRKIQDGFDYALDSRGNVKKDSAGNDIKVPKYKTIICDVIETHQEKVAHIEGIIEYQNNASNQIIMSKPVAADNIFTYDSYTANGDRHALSDRSRDLIKNRNTPAPFPANMDLIYGAAETLRQAIFDVLKHNRKFAE